VYQLRAKGQDTKTAARNRSVNQQGLPDKGNNTVNAKLVLDVRYTGSHIPVYKLYTNDQNTMTAAKNRSMKSAQSGGAVQVATPLKYCAKSGGGVALGGRSPQVSDIQGRAQDAVVLYQRTSSHAWGSTSSSKAWLPMRPSRSMHAFRDGRALPLVPPVPRSD